MMRDAEHISLISPGSGFGLAIPGARQHGKNDGNNP